MISTLCASCCAFLVILKHLDRVLSIEFSVAQRRAAHQTLLLMYLAAYLFFTMTIALIGILLPFLWKSRLSAIGS